MGGRPGEVWARADDCDETLAYATFNQYVWVSLETGGAYVIRAEGGTWVSFVLPAASVELIVDLP